MRWSPLADRLAALLSLVLGHVSKRRGGGTWRRGRCCDANRGWTTFSRRPARKRALIRLVVRAHAASGSRSSRGASAGALGRWSRSARSSRRAWARADAERGGAQARDQLGQLYTWRQQLLSLPGAVIERRGAAVCRRWIWRRPHQLHRSRRRPVALRRCTGSRWRDDRDHAAERRVAARGCRRLMAVRCAGCWTRCTADDHARSRPARLSGVRRDRHAQGDGGSGDAGAADVGGGPVRRRRVRLSWPARRADQADLA